MKTEKNSIIKIVLIISLLLITLLSTMLVVSLVSNNKLKKQIDNIENNDVYNGDLDNYFIIEYQYNEINKKYILSKETQMSIYEFLLTQSFFKANDFSSFDGINYYFNNTFTDVLELKGNLDYYVKNEYGEFLIVGLQAINITKNLTIVRTDYEA